MAKRKAGLNDIIFELDDEIELSSEDEVKESKISRLGLHSNVDLTINNRLSEGSCVEIICSPNKNDEDFEKLSQTSNKNGGKTPSVMLVENSPNVISVKSQETEDEPDNTEKVQTISLNNTEDLDVGYWDETPAGCENRTPLLSVRFKSKKLANDYKEKIKKFMIKLIKLHEEESSIESGSDTDLELDIWPEDLNEDLKNEQIKDEAHNLFFVDAAPCDIEPVEVPRYYSQTSTIISNSPDKEQPTLPPTGRRKPTCFNCDGAHPLRDCPLPRNNARIAENRKNMPAKLGRYHVEDEQKYGHLIPGRISGALRHALKLKRNELPLHIYHMRLLGYPPGWLEEARISHSGITMFDSSGKVILEPEEEEGQLHEPGSRDKFDIKKILDFPGFNMPASSRYKDKAHLLGLPPMSELDSKISMLQMLAPNAMKAYKRKKLSLFPSGLDSLSQESHTAMDLDSGDEEVLFPSVPPLPDEAPPPIPPPPNVPPPPPPLSSPDLPPLDSPIRPPGIEDNEESTQDEGEKSADDMEIIEITEVKDIPIPQTPDTIAIDDDNDDKEHESNGRNSVSLDDLEEKKRLILSALESDDIIGIPEDSVLQTQKCETLVQDPEVSKGKDEISDTKSNDVINDANEDTKDAKDNDENTSDTAKTHEEVININEAEVTAHAEDLIEIDAEIDQNNKVCNTSNDSPSTNSINSPSTAITKTGGVKTTSYGTPVLNIASPYVTLPSGGKFAKDICDVIHFENLPNSTGKYKRICSLLKKVKSEVDRIQES